MSAGGVSQLPQWFFIKHFSSPRFEKAVSGFSWTSAPEKKYSMQEMKMALMDTI